MKLSRLFSGVFLYIALGLMMLALFLVMAKPGTPPVLLSPAQDAQDQVVEMMDALCQGDFSAVEQHLLGNPSLGVDRELTDNASALIWDAFVASFSYELSGDCYATDTGVAQDVTLTYLDIPSVTAGLAQRSEKHLAQLQQEATHTSDIYDENGNFHNHLVLQVFDTAVREALQEDSKLTSCTFTLQLVQRDGQWYVIANSDFIDAISGGM